MTELILSNPGDSQTRRGAYEQGRNGIAYIGKLSVTEIGDQCSIDGITSARDTYVTGGFHQIATKDLLALCHSFLEEHGYEVISPDDAGKPVVLLQPMQPVEPPKPTPRAIVFCMEGGSPESVYCDQDLKVIVVEPSDGNFDDDHIIKEEDGEEWGLYHGVYTRVQPEEVDTWYGYVAEQQPEFEV